MALACGRGKADAESGRTPAAALPCGRRTPAGARGRRGTGVGRLGRLGPVGPEGFFYIFQTNITDKTNRNKNII